MADEVFYTKTMARIHADQGNFGKAAEIYRYLLDKEPSRPDIIEALADLERLKRLKRIEDLIPLIEEWTKLAMKYRRLGRERPGFGNAISEFRRGVEDEDIDISDSDFTGLRDASAGREVGPVG